MTALLLAAVLTFAPATSGTAPVVTWYGGSGYWGRPMACGGVLHRRTVGVASLRLACGTRVRLTWRGRAITLPVIDHTGGVLFDQTRAACRLWIGRCRTLRHVEWRVVP